VKSVVYRFWEAEDGLGLAREDEELVVLKKRKGGGRGEICEVYIVGKSNLHLVFLTALPACARDSYGSCDLHSSS
jgi:hypothetical protein